ncbi:MAG: biotin transporter BioY [Bacteroidota bacterium]|nr:biotin transporter BioY [Bacteroidota bacterium]MDP4190847.1 biotin transporter BioY [Bacteroidota bacterium]MDP4193884.1 biotin transporter BioY [Bacteroidota bacterium]
MSVNENVKNLTGLKYFGKVVSSELFWVSAFAVLTFLAAQVSVPVQPVPFTLQTMLVLMAGAFLGPKNGALSQILYLGLGAIGLPVFANFSSFTSLFGPTGGYLLAFPVAAYLVGLATEKNKSLLSVAISMTLASFLILFLGASYLSLFWGKGLGDSFFVGAVIFSVWDLIKLAAAASIYSGISKRYARLPL